MLHPYHLSGIISTSSGMTEAPLKIILGIDPGSRITGYGIIQSNGNRHSYITSGCIRTGGDDMPSRLQQIFSGIDEIIRTFKPAEVGIEQIFMEKNAGSALKLGHARGAAIVAAANHALAIAEYSARMVKLAVVGYGAADKSQVQHMVKCLLNLSAKPQADAADALAVAICHAHAVSSVKSMGM